MTTTLEPLDALRPLIPQPTDHLELNAGTLSPTPLPLMDAADVLRREQASGASAFFFHRVGKLIAAARASLAMFLKVAENDLFLLPNVTHGMNVALYSVPFRMGDAIVTTNHEYGAMKLILDDLVQRYKLELRMVELESVFHDPDAIVEAFKALVDDKTRLVFFSHVMSPTALTLPAERIVDAVARDDLYTVIDGAHGPCAVPVDISAIGADAYGANCHKWMMAPCGAGFLHVSGRFKLHLVPMVRSWGEAMNLQQADEVVGCGLGPEDGATRLQYRIEYHGVSDRVPQMILPETIAFLDRVGVDRMIAESQRLANYARQSMQEIGLACGSPTHHELVSPMTIYPLSSEQAVCLKANLWPKHRVLCPITSANGKQYLRISTAWFNTPEQIERMQAAVKSCLEA